MKGVGTTSGHLVALCGILVLFACPTPSEQPVDYSAGTAITVEDGVISVDLGTKAGQAARGEDVAELQNTTAQLQTAITPYSAGTGITIEDQVISVDLGTNAGQAARGEYVAALQSTVGSLTTQVEALASLEETTTALETSVADLDIQIGEHTTALADLETQLGGTSTTVNVRHFGATGDGTTDDSAAIQAAIDHAGSLSSVTLQSTGVEVFFPAGEYFIETTIQVPYNSLGLRGPAGRGAKLMGDTLLFDIGDYSNSFRVSHTEFDNLFIAAASRDNTTAAIKLYRTTNTLIQSCHFQDFYIHLDCNRASTTVVTMNRFSNARRTANALATIRLQGVDEDGYSPGGGMHITDNEFAGARHQNNTEMNYTEAHLLVHSVDGLYLQNNHYVGAHAALKVEPLATAANHVITDIKVTQEYYDNPSHLAAQSYNVLLTGTAGGFTGARYQGIKFINCLFRGANIAQNSLRISVTGGELPHASAVKNISVIGGTIRQAVQTGVVVQGSSAAMTEVQDLLIEGAFFADNNFGGMASTSAISVETENVTIASNNFAADAVPTPRCIQVTMSDDYSGAPGAVVAGNNFSASNYAPDPAEMPYNNSPVRYSTNRNARVQLSDNLFAGAGKRIDQVYRRSTSDAAAVPIFEYRIPETAAGDLRLRLAGSSDDGSVSASYEWQGSFVNGPGAASWMAPVTVLRELSSGGASATLIEPLTNNTIQLLVSGIDSTAMTWVCHVELLGSK